ncbi:MAG TPA: hypothetical protein VLC52_06510 [Anaerolineae bacterium]|nr:hypothetical protein [Anaerolineae bacterium]
MGKALMGSGEGRGREASRALPRRGRRHPLLLQKRLQAMLFWPALLIALITTALVILEPPGIEAHRLYLVVAGIGGWALAILTLWFSLRAHVYCCADGLRLRFPFYELLIPYRDIQSTRLAQLGRQYPPQGESWSRRQFLEPLFPSTVVVVELESLPAPRRQLHLWMSRYVLSPDTPGFMLPVRDWLAFRSELDEFRSRSYMK